MVEKRGAQGVLAHVVMVIGVFIIAFPLYLAFVASTHTNQEIVQAPMPLLPGGNIVNSFRDALFGEGHNNGSNAPVLRMMQVSLITALVISVGKIAISLLSAFAIVYFRFPFRKTVFWAVFITLMLPIDGENMKTHSTPATAGATAYGRISMVL